MEILLRDATIGKQHVGGQLRRAALEHSGGQGFPPSGTSQNTGLTTEGPRSSFQLHLGEGLGLLLTLVFPGAAEVAERPDGLCMAAARGPRRARPAAPSAPCL